MTNATKIPATEWAIQLTGPGTLELNKAKSVVQPGPQQVLARIEAVGLCFSDLKLLKQFSGHARKSEILTGISKDVLAEISSYVPGDKPTVPGHEAVGRIVAVGSAVKHHKVGERVLVQTDYRTLRTASSNAAFGYSFEGGLQEYVIMDERVIMDPLSGERFLIPVAEHLSASEIGLVEPWACVENSYVTIERQGILGGGRLLVVVEPGHEIQGLDEAVKAAGKAPVQTVIKGDAAQVAAAIAALADATFDDIVYFGAVGANVVELDKKLAAKGIFNLVTAGKTFGAPANIDVGRVHYGCIRFTGTVTASAVDGYKHIPKTGELRANDRVLIIGAAGPMGQMHVIRCACTDVKGVSVVGTDFDNGRLANLDAKVQPMAKKNNVKVELVNPKDTPVTGAFDYIAVMAPVAPLVAQAVKDSKPGAIINIFAGIPAGTRTPVDLDLYVKNRCWMFGTSGSVIEDMKIVLRKVTAGQLNTNASVDAVSGMAGALDGLLAVENRTLAGKVIVYPELHDLDLVPLTDLAKRFPTVAAKLDNGLWTLAAEQELLKVAK